jgi:hypothetical protein
MRAILFAILFACAAAAPAGAGCLKSSDGSTVCPNASVQLVTTEATGTVATAGTWYDALVDDPLRQGCLIINRSSGFMEVFFGPGTPSYGVNTIPLPPFPGYLSCGTGNNGVATDRVRISAAVNGAPYVTTYQRAR